MITTSMFSDQSSIKVWITAQILQTWNQRSKNSIYIQQDQARKAHSEEYKDSWLRNRKSKFVQVIPLHKKLSRNAKTILERTGEIIRRKCHPMPLIKRRALWNQSGRWSIMQRIVPTGLPPNNACRAILSKKNSRYSVSERTVLLSIQS